MRELQAARGTAISSVAPAGADAASGNRRRPALLATIGAVALVGYGLDRLTKHLALSHLDPANPPTYLGGLLRFRLISNPGAAFSMGSSATIVFTVLAMLAFLAVLAIGVRRVTSTYMAVVCGLALAGIAGNLTDRLVRPPGALRGEVVDFISLPHFAIFNVADICITLTAALLLLSALRRDDATASASTADRQSIGNQAVAAPDAETGESDTTTPEARTQR